MSINEFLKNHKKDIAILVGIIVAIVVGIIIGMREFRTGALAVVFVAIFALLIVEFYIEDKYLNKGEVRRSITITLIGMYIILLFLSLSPDTKLNFEENIFINNFHDAILVILAFYFGSRAFETAMGARTSIKDLAAKIFKIDNSEEMPIEELREKIKDIVDKTDEKDLKNIIKEINDTK